MAFPMKLCKTISCARLNNGKTAYCDACAEIRREIARKAVLPALPNRPLSLTEMLGLFQVLAPTLSAEQCINVQRRCESIFAIEAQDDASGVRGDIGSC